MHLTELVTQYMESALNERQQLSFETHLVFCGDCQVFLGQIRDTVRQVGELPREPIAVAERQAILGAYDTAR